MYLVCVARFWYWGGHRDGEKLPENSPMSDSTNATGSKTDLPLDKAEPISDGSSAYVIIYLKRGKKLLCKKRRQPERGLKICERRNSADTEVSEEGGGRRCSRHQSRDSPAAHGEEHGEAGCALAARGGPQWSRSPPVARGRDPTLDQVDA